MKIKVGSIYLCVKNMKRAVTFYEKLLDKKVDSFAERMSSFGMGNLSLLLFDPTVDGEIVTWGNNEVINFEVEDIQEIKKLIDDVWCDIIMPLEQVEKFLIFQFKDTEGNIVEVFSETS